MPLSGICLMHNVLKNMMLIFSVYVNVLYDISRNSIDDIITMCPVLLGVLRKHLSAGSARQV